MQVREIMSTDVETLSPDLPVSDLEDRLISHRVGGFPVVDEGKLVGMVTRSDLVRVLDLEHTIDAQLGEAVGAIAEADSATGRGARIGARLEAMTVADVMIRGVVFVSPTDEVTEAARTMVSKRVHRLPVVDAGRLVGIVTSLDVARLVAEGRSA